MIQKPFSDDLIRPPLKVQGAALPGAQEGNPASLEGSKSVTCSRERHPLADHDGPWPGPGVEPLGVGRLAAVVG